MIEVSVQDDVLHANGKPIPWFTRIGDRWEYLSEGPGPNFRVLFTIRENDPVFHEQYQYREDDEWIDIENPWTHTTQENIP